MLQLDVNVSLTAISLMWNAADLLGKGGSSAKEAEGLAAEAGQQMAGDQDAQQTEALLRQLLNALQVCLLSEQQTMAELNAQLSPWQTAALA